MLTVFQNLAITYNKVRILQGHGCVELTNIIDNSKISNYRNSYESDYV